MNTVSYNREAWNRQSRSGSRWTIPVDPKTIGAAKAGDWQVILTPNKFVPRKWFGDLKSLPKEKLDRSKQEGLAYEFGHTLEDQIGGQIEAGFAISGFYEDDWDQKETPLNQFTSMYISTLGIKADF